MRWPPALLALAWLVLCATACGGGKIATTSTSRSIVSSHLGSSAISSIHTPAGSYVRGDDDEDGDTYNLWDDHHVREYGHAASAPERQEIVSLVKHYYAAAYAGDGATGCSLLYSKVATSPHMASAVPPDYDPPVGSTFPRQESCVQFVSWFFKQAHQQLVAADSPTLIVTAVRIRGSHGLVLLGFKTAFERKIQIQREHGSWKIDELLDDEII